MTSTKIRTRHVWRLSHLSRLFVAALVLLSGCRAVQPGAVVEHQPGEGPKTSPVPYSATYELLAVDDTGARLTHVEWATIERKLQVGFVRHGDGGLIGYAGGRRFPIPEGHYVWQITPDSQKTRGELARADANRVLKVMGQGVAYAVVAVGGLGLLVLAGMCGASGASGAGGGHY